MIELREPAIAYGKQKLTIEEYLIFEKQSLERHEYYQGEICYGRWQTEAFCYF